jgi:ribosomal protein S18 acetylase RimI-like enzyme
LPIVVREITPGHLNSVASVHLQAFTDSALTKLGQEAVRRYYEWQLIGPHDCLAIGAFDDDILIGFCFGGVFRGALGGFLEKNRIFLIRRVVTHPQLLLNPLFRERAWLGIQRLSQRFRRQKSEIPNPLAATRSFGILSIAVIPTSQGEGVAQLLMEYSQRIAIGRGFTQMSLTVHPTNNRAVRFYEKMGWQRDPIDGVWKGRMSKTIV